MIFSKMIPVPVIATLYRLQLNRVVVSRNLLVATEEHYWDTVVMQSSSAQSHPKHPVLLSNHKAQTKLVKNSCLMENSIDVQNKPLKNSRKKKGIKQVCTSKAYDLKMLLIVHNIFLLGLNVSSTNLLRVRGIKSRVSYKKKGSRLKKFEKNKKNTKFELERVSWFFMLCTVSVQSCKIPFWHG